MIKKSKSKKAKVSVREVRRALKASFANADQFRTTPLTKIRQILIARRAVPKGCVIVRFVKAAHMQPRPVDWRLPSATANLLLASKGPYVTGLRSAQGWPDRSTHFRVYPSLDNVPTEELTASLPAEVAHDLLLAVFGTLPGDNNDAIASVDICLNYYEETLREHGVLQS